ncbi:MAG: hypothetical protein KDK71_09320 [Chlamydiia bacterium]|nr:hypothetical protein [Nanoarchaeota archaeon]MCB1116656.1 hypothetical protein [Chlamydiia bacterium]
MFRVGISQSYLISGIQTFWRQVNFRSITTKIAETSQLACERIASSNQLKSPTLTKELTKATDSEIANNPQLLEALSKHYEATRKDPEVKEITKFCMHMMDNSFKSY